MHHQAGWHPSHASGNVSGTSVVLGIIGLAINPLLGIAGMLLGDKLHNCSNKVDRYRKYMHDEYGMEDTPFWAKPDNGVNSFRNNKGQLKK